MDRVGPAYGGQVSEPAPMPGDEVIAAPDLVMDRRLDLAAPPAEVWPWLDQLGKRRGGWYMPRLVERFVPRSRRALRHLDASLQGLTVGDRKSVV